ncbi:MAG: proteasome assembly chaperone family protein [Thaumarchaeota archaeon]|nr:proteasome assembly chaperone family protein [Nitrososphaerota archaeon]
MVVKVELIPKNVRLSGKKLVTGFHGIGATGYWTIKYLVQQLKPERIAFIDTDATAPLASTWGGRIITPYELYQKDDLLFLRAEVAPSRGVETKFFRELCNMIISKGIAEVALVGGLDASLRMDQSTFKYVKTGAFEPQGILKDAKFLEDDRMIIGPVALMLNQFEMRNFPAFAILPYASVDRIDPRAAAEAAKILSKYFSFKIDIDPLIKGAEVIESEVSALETKVKSSTESIYT